MAYLAEYTVHCDRLPLVDVAAAVPAATIEVSVGQPNQGGPPPFAVTVRAPDGPETGAPGDAEAILEDAETALADSPFIAELVHLGAAARSRRYRVVPATSMEEQLGPAVSDVDRLQSLAATQAILEYAEVVRDGWRQRRRCADREAFEAYWSFWREEGSVTIHRLVEAPEPDPHAAPGTTAAAAALSDPQREALLTAHDLGYFGVPRDASLADVADALDISEPACSERLRRAQAALVDGALAGPAAASGGGLVNANTD